MGVLVRCLHITPRLIELMELYVGSRIFDVPKLLDIWYAHRDETPHRAVTYI